MKLKETEFQDVDQMIQEVDSGDEMMLVEMYYKLTMSTVIEITTQSCVHSGYLFCLYEFSYLFTQNCHFFILHKKVRPTWKPKLITGAKRLKRLNHVVKLAREPIDASQILVNTAL